MWILVGLGCCVAFAAFRSGGVDPGDSFLVSLLVACLALLYAATAPAYGWIPRLPAVVRWTIVLLPLYIALQLVPLPVAVIRVLSPERAALLHKVSEVAGTVAFAPLSIAPAEALRHFARIGSAILLLLVIHDVGARERYRRWALIAPVICVAAVEAVLGISQYYLGEGEARGTWLNRNHFASFLAMCLPFPAMYAASFVNAAPGSSERGHSSYGVASIVLGVAGLLLLGVTYSMSRMGFASAILSLSMCGVAVAASRVRNSHHGLAMQLGIAGGLVTVIMAAFLLLAPPELVARFAQFDFSDGISRQDRFDLWSESLSLIPAYPVFGTGLGGYESAFLRYKVTSPMVRDDFAHNDYLQYAIELGAVGSLIVICGIAAVLYFSVRAAVRCSGEDRTFAAACCASFVAILAHSLVDFNLYLPANTFLLAWVAGAACSLHIPSRRARRAVLASSSGRRRDQENALGAAPSVAHRYLGSRVIGSADDLRT